MKSPSLVASDMGNMPIMRARYTPVIKKRSIDIEISLAMSSAIEKGLRANVREVGKFPLHKGKSDKQ